MYEIYRLNSISEKTDLLTNIENEMLILGLQKTKYNLDFLNTSKSNYYLNQLQAQTGYSAIIKNLNQKFENIDLVVKYGSVFQDFHRG